ncbi:MAG: X2-like carbohydrate binding domain-containing protein, partial [Bacilli bacterium]
MKRNLIALLTMLGLIASFASSCSDEATILSINSEFDFNVLNDITFEITGNANQISHLEGHNIADGDYEISSSLLTINKNYLVNLIPGKYEFKVWFSHHSENISLTILDKNNQYRLINGSFETGNYFG